MLKKIYENDLFIIKDTQQDYDFRYTIENKKNYKINLYLNGIDDYLEIESNEWVGLFNGDYSEDIINCLINENYELENEKRGVE